MKLRSTIAILLLMVTNLMGQGTQAEKEVVAEGKKLYRLEMTSWNGTDLLRSKLSEKMGNVGGYCSYETEKNTVCIFFTKAEPRKVIASFAFDSTYNSETAVIDVRERSLNDLESDIVAIRQLALKEINTDPFFKKYPDTNLNLIPVIDDKGKRLYVLTGPRKNGVVIFGNDYLLTFDKNNNLKSKESIHQNIIPVTFEPGGERKVIGSSHTHLPETSELITPTDICTLMLYQKFTHWKTHLVTSWKYLSQWDCENNTLTVIPQKDLKKSANDQLDRN